MIGTFVNMGTIVVGSLGSLTAENGKKTFPGLIGLDFFVFLSVFY